MKTKRCLPLGALVCALGTAVLAPTAQAVDANKVIDLRADRLRVTGANPAGQVLSGAKYVPTMKVRAGTTIAFACDWSANLVGAGYWKTHVAQDFQILLRHNGHTLATRKGSVPAGKELGGKTKNSPIPFVGGSTATNLGEKVGGSTEAVQWTAADPGEHRFECVIPKTGLDEPTLENNIATVVVMVEPVQIALLAPTPDSQPGPPTTPVMSAPRVATPAAAQATTAAAALPAVQSAKPATGARSTVPPLAQSGAAALPDLVSDDAVAIGTQAAQWGAIVTVDARSARRLHNGFCEFAVRHTLRNAGGANATASTRRWTNDHVPGQWTMESPPLAVQASGQRTDTLPLTAGRNVLYLALDPAHTLNESNAQNNLKRIAIDVNGQCGTPAATTKTFQPSRW